MQPSDTDIKLRVENALIFAANYGDTDGSHHKMWVIDQMVRALTGSPIITRKFVNYKGQPCEFETFGESDEYRAFTDQYEDWDVGKAP